MCQWGIIHKKSCGGHSQACGPWNGRCAVREAFLEANLLPEPSFPGDLASELQYIANLVPKVSRADDIMRRMAGFRRRNPGYDFGRGSHRR